MAQRPTTLRSVLVLAALVLGALTAMQGLQAWSRARLGAQIAAAAKPGDIFMIASVSCVFAPPRGPGSMRTRCRSPNA